MMLVAVLFLVSVSGSLGFICRQGKEPVISKKFKAVINADSKSDKYNKISGFVIFELEDEKWVHVYGEVNGLPDGAHGMHVHENPLAGSRNKFDCSSAGAHFNPLKMLHGGPQSLSRHVGDLGTIVSYKKKATFDFYDNQVAITPSDFDRLILCRSVVVHEYIDDNGLGGLNSLGKVNDTKVFQESIRTGNAGPRLACGTIFPTCENKVKNACPSRNGNMKD